MTSPGQSTVPARSGAAVRAHYDTVLGERYGWMVGDLAEAVAGQAELLQSVVGPAGRAGAAALDLGCGTGVHTLALARLGYGPVTCVDTSARVLEELAEHARGVVGVTPLLADLDAGLPSGVEPGSVTVAVCMGDSLTHLSDLTCVARLLAGVRAALEPGGTIVLSFRDLSRPPVGADRFIPVRSDADRIMTAFLEDAGSHVLVHDLFHERDADGRWVQQVSSYPKLKVSAETVAGLLSVSGYDVPTVEQGPRGLWVVAARRPAAG